MSYGLLIRMGHTDCQSLCPTVKKNVIFTQSHRKNAKIATIIDNQQPTKQCTNKPKMIKRTTYLEGEQKCVKPMNEEKYEKPRRRRRRRRRSLLCEWRRSQTPLKRKTMNSRE